MDTGYAEFMEDCRRERASLIGLVEAIENRMLIAGLPITIPDAMKDVTVATVTALQQAVKQMNTLIDAYDVSTTS